MQTSRSVKTWDDRREYKTGLVIIRRSTHDCMMFPLDVGLSARLNFQPNRSTLGATAATISSVYVSDM